MRGEANGSNLSNDETRVSPDQMQAAAVQYQVYVEMTEALVERRAAANRFYLSLNTALFAGVGFLRGSEMRELVEGLDFIVVVIALLGLASCWGWLGILRSHRLLMGLKFQTIWEMERRLPFDPYHDEWRRGHRGGKKKPTFAGFELRLPWLFALAHLGVIGLVLWTSEARAFLTQFVM